MKNKPILILLVLLFIASAAFGTYGFLLSKNNQTKPEDNKPKVAYEFYLEDELVNAMPSKTDEEGNTYDFSKYICDNNMVLDFNSETWEYTLSNESTGVCKLYFVKGTYNVEITATNGLINGEQDSNSFTVARGADGQFNVVPNEGYEFDEITCANDKEATYDLSTNMININSISENIACRINFNKKNLKLDIVVKNGTGSTTENKEYGESISAIVQPNEGYQKPKITCTNKQEFTYEDNKLTIAKLTDNSVCTVTFSKTPAVTYNLIIKDIPDTVTITAGNKKQSIVSGKDGKFSLKADEGYKIILDCNGVKPSNEKEDPDGSITYTFLGVKRNITCNINTQIVETEPTTDETGN